MQGNRLLFIMVLPILAGISGCSTIVHGVDQPVSVETTPSNAVCTLKNDRGQWDVNNTPEKVVVHKSADSLDVQCHKDGYQPSEEKVNPTMQKAMFGNVLLGGVIGATLDASNGSAYCYPSIIKIVMQPLRVD